MPACCTNSPYAKKTSPRLVFFSPGFPRWYMHPLRWSKIGLEQRLRAPVRAEFSRGLNGEGRSLKSAGDFCPTHTISIDGISGACTANTYLSGARASRATAAGEGYPAWSCDAPSDAL